MVTLILWAIGIFAVFLGCKPHIDQFYPVFRFLGYLIGVGWPISIIGDPICSYIYKRMKSRAIAEDMRHAFNLDFGHKSQASAYQNPYQEAPQPEPEAPSILTQAQIDQLNKLRQRMDPLEAKHFPMIRLKGAEMRNIVPRAGIFTAKIRKKGGNDSQDIVVMLSTVSAVKGFDRAYNISRERDFYAEGHLLPSRTGVCYSVLYVTVFRLGDQVIL